MTLLALILLGLCCVLAYLFWKSSTDSRASTSGRLGGGPKPYSKDELRLENVGPEAVIRLTGIGENLEEFDLTVISRHVYRQGESTWYELECDRGDEKVWLDMEEDDELEVAVGLRKLKLRELSLTAKDLERMDDNEDGEFSYNGETYYLEDSDSAVFYRHGHDKSAEKFYYWDFESSDSKRFIGVERWSDGSYDVTYSEAIKPSQITVYSIGKVA